MKLSCVSLFLGLALAQNDGGSSNDASLTDVLDANNSTLSVLSGQYPISLHLVVITATSALFG